MCTSFILINTECTHRSNTFVQIIVWLAPLKFALTKDAQAPASSVTMATISVLSTVHQLMGICVAANF